MTPDVVIPVTPPSTLDCHVASHGTALAASGTDPTILGAYWGFDRAPDPQPPLGGFLIFPADVLAPARELLGVQVDRRVYPGPEALVDGLRPFGDAAVVTLDAFHLAHTPQYLTAHHPHALVLTGRTRSAVTVIDAYSGAPFTGPIPHADLARALLFPVGGTALLDPRLPRDGRVVATRVAAGLHRRLTAALARTALRNEVDHLSRLGLDRLCDALDCLAERVAEGDMEPEEQIEVLSAFGSLAAQRHANSVYLTQVAELLGRADLGRAAERALAVSRQWSVARNVGYLRGPRDGFAGALRRARAVLDDEAELIILVERAATTLSTRSDDARPVPGTGPR